MFSWEINWRMGELTESMGIVYLKYGGLYRVIWHFKFWKDRGLTCLKLIHSGTLMVKHCSLILHDNKEEQYFLIFPIPYYNLLSIILTPGKSALVIAGLNACKTKHHFKDMCQYRRWFFILIQKTFSCSNYVNKLISLKIEISTKS